VALGGFFVGRICAVSFLQRRRVQGDQLERCLPPPARRYSASSRSGLRSARRSPKLCPRIPYRFLFPPAGAIHSFRTRTATLRGATPLLIPPRSTGRRGKRYVAHFATAIQLPFGHTLDIRSADTDSILL
jgi:hypothetical protein